MDVDAGMSTSEGTSVSSSFYSYISGANPSPMSNKPLAGESAVWSTAPGWWWAPGCEHVEGGGGTWQDFRLLQPIWDAVRDGRETYLCSPLFPVLLSIIVYFVAVLPFMIVDLYGHKWEWIQKYKIQASKQVTWPLVRQTIWVTAWNHVMYILPTAIAQWIWSPPTPLSPQAPSMLEYVGVQVASLILFDLYYYGVHWSCHKNRWLYRWIHSIHHEYHSPFSWCTQYLHPWELLLTGLGTTVIPWVFNPHCFTWWSFMLLNIFVSVEAHVGFDFPWGAHHWFPFGIYGGSVKHDMHHQKPFTNFQPHLNTFDILFGTYCPPMMAGGKKTVELVQFEANRRALREAKYDKLELEVVGGALTKMN